MPLNLRPNDRDRLATFVLSEQLPLPDATPGNTRTLVHDDILALRYKVPFLPLIGMWQSCVSVLVDANGVVELNVPDGAYMALFTAAIPEGSLETIYVGLDCVALPTVAGESIGANMVPITERNAVGPVLLNNVQVLRVQCSAASPMPLCVLFWSALA